MKEQRKVVPLTALEKVRVEMAVLGEGLLLTLNNFNNWSVNYPY